MGRVLAFSEGTEVTTINKAISYVGKVTHVRKFGKRIKYKIDWYGYQSKYETPWYDHFALKKMSEKRREKEVKKAKQFEATREEMLEAREEAKFYLSMMSCQFPSSSLDKALDEVGFPFGLQTVMAQIIKDKGYLPTEIPISSKLKPMKFNSYDSFKDAKKNKNITKDLVGKKIRRAFDGKEYEGTVTRRKYEWYHIEYEDGDEEDLEGYEVIKYLYPRLEMPSSLGRRYNMLELFAGTAVVSDAFYQQEWNVESVDIDPNSNAKIKKDILLVEPSDFEHVPDFIWASPPCETYSALAGGYHRCISDGDLDRSPVARLHNFLFMKMIQLMVWARSKHPHLIIVIENPVGKLRKMPLMEEFARHFNLKCVEVHYCTFGRDERKATHLWTNYHNLADHLSDHKCSEQRCCVLGQHQAVRGACHLVDFASIPELLSKEVARVVNSRFILDRIHQYEAAEPSPCRRAMTRT